jgi:hypothetical protein
MTPESQRIAIAEACGWKNHDHPDVMQFKQGWTMPEKWCMDPKGVLRFNHERPNYLNDLNAMHDAERVLWEMDWSFRTIFNDHLANIIKRRKVNRNEWDAETLLDATASQRAEAFLRTIGKFKEAKL